MPEQGHGTSEGANTPSTPEAAEVTETAKITRTDAEWREQLSAEQYHVTREKGTERAFSGAYWKTKTKGTYHCIGCDLPLYSSETKFASGTGWPSFWAPVKADAIASERDGAFGMVRTELLCERCGAHLGHLFPDGPKPTGERHCINSASLRLVEASE